MTTSSTTDNFWRPWTQEKISKKPIKIVDTKGSYYIADNGDKYFDGISSWWVNIHGHRNKELLDVINSENLAVQQIITTDFTHPELNTLSKNIIEYTHNQFKKVFFTDNGSSSIEVAVKIALQYWKNTGHKKTRVIAFSGGYHGDTLCARLLSSAVETETAPYNEFIQIEFIPPPMENDRNNRNAIEKLSEILEKYNDIAAFVYEPMVQGVAGMKFQDPKVLREILKAVKEKNIITIADEILTGFYRTGKRFASDHVDFYPDIMCLSKALTGGMVPLALTLVNKKVYSSFYSDSKNKALLYGHSFCGNAIGCALANKSIEILERAEVQNKIQYICKKQNQFCNQFNKRFNYKASSLGTILAIEYTNQERSGYFNNFSSEISNYFMKHKVILRPLGNKLYFMPPYSSCLNDIDYVHELIINFTKELE
ncbi:MAG: adenosylmethionine--8-amino-7-oxononanoate transaminase [Bacteriovoracaceae bacterium]|nr:adenosylmethionine--8-amino-7-oxononanoate transaminase [Bacteriovoracaceae bacterium]